MDPTETVEEYYETLRRGDPLAPFFATGENVVKFGVSERLAGGSAVAEGLREQTRTTEDWRVESEDLRVTTHDSQNDATPHDSQGDATAHGSQSDATAHGSQSDATAHGSQSDASVAWFTDDVALAWTDSAGTRHSFDTRWSGVLEREVIERGDDSREAGNDWRFAQMHVSAPHDLSESHESGAPRDR